MLVRPTNTQVQQDERIVIPRPVNIELGTNPLIQLPPKQTELQNNLESGYPNFKELPVLEQMPPKMEELPVLEKGYPKFKELQDIESGIAPEKELIDDLITNNSAMSKEDQSRNEPEKSIKEAASEKVLGDKVKGSEEESFKAKAKKSVRDWTNNDGMQYISQINPYAAAGMGFANQMANPFKQKYFESRADENEAEEARRLNYEMAHKLAREKLADDRYNDETKYNRARQEKLDARQARRDAIEDELRKLEGIGFYKGENINVPFLSTPEKIMDPSDAQQYNAAKSLIESPFEYDDSTIAGKRKHNEKMLAIKRAQSVISYLNNKYASKAGLIDNNDVKDALDEPYRKNEDIFDKLKKNQNRPGHEKTVLGYKSAYDGAMFGPVGNFIDELTSFGAADKKAKVRTQISEIGREYRPLGYSAKIVTKDTIRFAPTRNAQIASRQQEIKRLLDQKNAVVVQLVSPEGTDIVTYLVTPDGRQSINNVVGLSSKGVDLNAIDNINNDVRPALRNY